jgi:hypothetical protein
MLLGVVEEPGIGLVLALTVLEVPELSPYDEVVCDVAGARRSHVVRGRVEVVELHPEERGGDDRIPRVEGVEESIDEAVRANHHSGKDQIDPVQIAIGCSQESTR